MSLSPWLYFVWAYHWACWTSGSSLSFLSLGSLHSQHTDNRVKQVELMGWSSFDRRHYMIIRQRPIDFTYPRSSRSDWADGPSYPRWTLGGKKRKHNPRESWTFFISSSQLTLTQDTYLWTNQLKPVYLTTSFLCVKQHISTFISNFLWNSAHFCIVKSSLAFDASHKMYREHNIFQIRFYWPL